MNKKLFCRNFHFQNAFFPNRFVWLEIPKRAEVPKDTATPLGQLDVKPEDLKKLKDDVKKDIPGSDKKALFEKFSARLTEASEQPIQRKMESKGEHILRKAFLALPADQKKNAKYYKAEKTGPRIYLHDTVDVLFLQGLLNKLGFKDDLEKSLVLDGNWGDLTQQALKKFQAQAKITQDGEFGPKTFEAMDKFIKAVEKAQVVAPAVVEKEEKKGPKPAPDIKAEPLKEKKEEKQEEPSAVEKTKTATQAKSAEETAKTEKKAQLIDSEVSKTETSTKATNEVKIIDEKVVKKFLDIAGDRAIIEDKKMYFKLTDNTKVPVKFLNGNKVIIYYEKIVPTTAGQLTHYQLTIYLNAINTPVDIDQAINAEKKAAVTARKKGRPPS